MRLSLLECLSSIIDNRGVTPHKKNTEWQDEGIPVLSAKNVKTDGIQNYEDIRFIDPSIYDSWMKEPLEKGDILLTSEAPAGEVYYWDSDVKIILGQRLYGLKVNKNIIDSKFLKYYLQSKRGQAEIKRHQSGSTVFGISAKTFKYIMVEAPDDINVQRKIGNALYSIDCKIKNNRNMINTFNQMVEKIFDYWFVQFDFDNEDGNPYKASGGAMEWNEKLKMNIPVGWTVTDLKNVSFDRGISYSSEEISDNDGVPMINLACIDINRNYRDGRLKFYNAKVNENDMLKPFDMLIASTDLTRNGDIVGCPIFVPDDDVNYTYSMDLVKVNIADEKITPSYLYMVLRTSFYHDYIKHFASGTNVLHLNVDGINRYETWIPPMSLQLKFETILHNVMKKEFQLINENRNLTEMREWLLAGLLDEVITLK